MFKQRKLLLWQDRNFEYNRSNSTEICLEAVKREGLVLVYVPKNLKTQEICFEAVKNLVERDLEIVPEPLRDEVRRALNGDE